MRMPDLDNVTSKVKIQSPLVGSITSNDSDPIDISRSSGSAASYSVSTLSFTSPPSHSLQHRPAPFRSQAGSYASSYSRRQSLSRSVGSFVGSYEESILSGRMSQTPSRPLDFTASIGVLGRGKCKASLRCPPHLTVPFPAYFYSEISPYVGQIDVEQQSVDGKRATTRGYRIPAEGQLQIIIKNPNKTAVKVFLIPYNVSDMPPLSKTFFRQKHYDAEDGDKLRYAIHIQISCPAEGKYYIHRMQRVVFANRVPDGKEKLKITIQSPQPAYIPWVPEKRQRRADQHTRPDGKEPKFIGGSLLDRDQDVIEEPFSQNDLSYTDGPLRDGQLTPRPSIRSPFLQPRRTSYMKSSNLGQTSTINPEMHSSTTSRGAVSGGILAERLKELAIARDAARS